MWRALCVGFLPIVAVTGQVTLEQNPRAVTVQEGDAVTFECSMKGGSLSSYYMYWYRQGRRGMEWISRDGYIYGEVFQGRFKATKDSSENRFPLQILAAQKGDAATYYCGARITLKQFCRRVNQKPRNKEDRSLSNSFWQLLPRALLRQWQCGVHTRGHISPGIFPLCFFALTAVLHTLLQCGSVVCRAILQE